MTAGGPLQRVVYGLRPVEELLRAGGEVAVVYLAEGEASPALRAIEEAAARRKVAVEHRDKLELSALAAGGVHQGALAIAGAYAYLEVEELLARALGEGERAPLVLLLDGVQDPQNLGAILRSAHVLGADGVILPRDRAAHVTPAAVKASAGATEHLPIALCTNVSRTLAALKQAGLWAVGAVAEGGQDPWAVDLAVPTVLVLGSEGRGLRPLVARNCDLRVRIPMAGRVASLNVAAAGAILLYEAARQRAAARPSP